MESLFYRKADLEKALNMPVKKAVKVLTEHGIKPVDLGPGRGNGLRWHVRAVNAVADTLHAEAQAQSEVPRRRRIAKAGCVLGKSPKELYVELYGTGAVH